MRLDLATGMVGQRSWSETMVDPWLQKRAEYRFGNEGDAASGKWKPLTAFTNEWRDLQGYPVEHPINVRSGALENWLTGVADGTFLGSSSMSGTYYWPGVHLPYDDFITAKLEVAQVGSPPGRNKLFPNTTTPPRPVVAIDSTDVLALLTSFHDFIEAFVGENAGSVMAAGTFGGAVSPRPSAPGSVRGVSVSSGGGGNFT